MLYFSRWSIISIIAIVSFGIIFAMPNLFSTDTVKEKPAWLPGKKMVLGLDLQGGSHLLAQIDRKSLIEEQLVGMKSEVRILLRENRIGYQFNKNKKDTLSIRIRDENQTKNALKILQKLETPVNSAIFNQGSIKEIAVDQLSSDEILLTLTQEGIDNRVSSAVTQSIEVIRRRIDELGTTEPVVQRQGKDRILIQVPGFDDPQRLKAVIGTTAKMTFHLLSDKKSAEDALRSGAPTGTKLLYEDSNPPIPYLIQNRVMVHGENLLDSQPSFDPQTNEPIVTFRFDTKGARQFAKVTSEHTGKLFAIVLDQKIISAPRINQPILGGSGQISGNFTVESANDLAVLLRAGALPATLTFLEERSVGPGLGQDSIDSAKIAAIIGVIAVALFMILSYGLLGFISNFALVINITIIVALLSTLGATLTLPGIAGIVLTMGMAVDANVLIYERIFEERRNGRNLIQAFDAGFKHAFSTILDANVTTLIAAVILFYLGSGPVRGFAVTLAIGIITTLFTAYTCTRLMIAVWIRYKRPKEMPKRIIPVLPQTKFSFMRNRFFTFTLSIIAAVASMLLFLTSSLNYGIDFKGGTLIEAQSWEIDKNTNSKVPADISFIRSQISDLDLGDVQVQQFGAPEDVLIRVESQDSNDSAEQTTINKIRAKLDNSYDFRRVEVVGPTVSSELAKAGIIAILVALSAIMVYIWIRFEWQFAIGAVLATLHDVILTIGIFSILQLEFNLSTIAAILTIVGYSLNDTVVVYDRIRENLRKHRKIPVPDLIDMSINEMLSRTILTSVTTLLALFSLFVFGGEVLASFTFAMIFGVFIGTYSSIFIAAPLLIFLKLRPEQIIPDDQNVNDKSMVKS